MPAPTPKEVRECYSDYRDEWQDIRDQAEEDMRAISVTGPWSDDDRREREENGRPCIHLDQINQYLHQYTGNLHRTKRAIQLTPKGNGASDEDAGKRSSVVRGIEERSNAPTNVYIPAAKSAAQRSYGFAVIRTEYKEGETFDQEILLKPVPNPDCVLLNPYYKQPNAQDIEDGFLLEPVSKKDFKRRFPKAKMVDFQDREFAMPGVSDWIKDKYVLTAEFWRIEYDLRTLLLIRSAEDPTPRIVWEDELENRHKNGKFRKLRDGIEVMREREVKEPRVVQYLTNGVEILDEIPWAGSRIPIIACLGPERWITVGGKARRELMSLVRFARDPQMLFDFLASQECEEAGMIPKTPFVGAVGQFETDAQTWEDIAHVPHGFAQYDPITDTTGENVLPPPSRPQYQANFQQWEMAKDGAGRAIQSGMSISPLPTAAQRSNQKSGVALEKIQNEEDIGTQAFLDNFENGFLHNLGWQVNELITPILDTQQEMPISEPGGKRKTLQLVGNTSHPIDESGAYEVQGSDGQPLSEDHLHTGKGEFDVTISSGPSAQSEREAQSEFVDSILENIQNLPQPGTPAAKVLALAIRMRPDLGPIGKQIADTFDPPDPSNLPPQAQAAIQQLQAQNQQLTQENSALHMERAAKVLELQTKEKIEAMKGQHIYDKSTMDFITQIVKAELAKGSKASEIQATTDAQKELQDLGFSHEKDMRAHDAAHESALAAQQHGQNLEAAQQSAQLNPPQPPGAANEQEVEG